MHRNIFYNIKNFYLLNDIKTHWLIDEKIDKQIWAKMK